jgi:hypothetical protein
MRHHLGASIAGVLLFAMGVAIAAGTYEAYSKDRGARERLLVADGTVVAVIGQGRSVRPVVAFVTSAGEHLSFTGKAPGSFASGNRVQVLYPPQNPVAAIVDDRASIRSRALLTTAVALLSAVLGAYVAWTARRAQLRPAEEP